MINEKIYESNLPIKYVFEEGTVNKDFLLIVFSGFSENTAKIKHAYNYMRTLKDFDCNKLYILDNYGESGCYYLGESMSYEVESSVLSLITSIIRKYHINHEKVILSGSSKGGTAALYLGLKYNFGYVIAGAFQTKIADYVTIRPEAYKYLLGTDSNPIGHDNLNSIIYKQLNKEIYTKLFFMSSENDWQYPEHIKLFLDTLKRKKIAYTYFDCKEMKDHSDVGNHFPQFLINKLLLILYFVDFIGVSCKLVDDTRFEGSINVNDPFNNLEFKFVLKEKNQVVYESKRNLDFTPTVPGYYTLILQINSNGYRIYEKELMQEFVGAGEYRLMGVNFQHKDNTLKLIIDTDSKDLTYAYYIYKNGSIINKIMYQSNNTLEFAVEEQGNYQIQYYIKDKLGKIAVSKTKQLVVN
ncbi:accessory Sec system protein Asp2 [Fictibacillus sp. JL2B1089]|uniref:accessory Sec system protein Asp2 n=1 Tax=Fictibacillus sp. JL2B1089 TaxID=3399565 RepID=UPI003A88F118